MNKRLLLSFLFLAIPSTGHGQSPSTIYIDCDVVRSYSVPDKRVVRERLSFKVDASKSTIYEFDFDKGDYINQCNKVDGNLKIGQSNGFCLVDDEAFRFTNVSEFAFFHNSHSITIYRSSGRLMGDLSMYQGPFKRGELDPNKRAMVDYALNGSCQKGVDLSTSKKAF